MKLNLISPGQYRFYTTDDYPVWYYRLGLPILAALTPPDWEVSIVEGNQADLIDFDEHVDLVGLSVLTPFAFKAYRIADAYRERGVTTILGGVHPSAMPDEAKKHADAVVVGEAEMIWGQILDDFKQGKLQEFYRQSDWTPMDKVPTPRRDLLDMSTYGNFHQLLPTRGCPAGCGFCVVPWLHGKAIRTRPIDKILKELDTIEGLYEAKSLIMSENFLSHRPFSRQLFSAYKPLGLRWSAEGYLPHLRDEDFLEATRSAGCYSIYVETEMVSAKKNPALLEAYEDAIEKLKKHGFDLLLNFTIGYDEDTPDVFEETIEFVERTQPTGYVAQVFTPWPGTRLFAKIEEEGRLLHRNWNYYDNNQVVFKPKQMSAKELREGYFHVMKRFEAMRRLPYIEVKLLAHPAGKGYDD